MEVMRNAHDNDHFGIKKIKKNVVKEYYISRLEKKLKDFISCCIPYIIANKKAAVKRKENYCHRQKVQGPSVFIILITLYDCYT